MTGIRRQDWKLRELLLYVSARDPKIAATKLNKVLYEADFRAFRDLGSPISGHPYVRRQNGPAPKDLRPIRTSLLVDGSAKLEETDIGMAHPEVRIVPQRDPALRFFSKAELKIVDDVINECRDLSGTALAERTHTHPGFNAAQLGDVIPYETAFVSNVLRPDDIQRGLELAAQHNW